MMGTIGIILGLAVLIVLSFKRWHPLISSVIASCVVVLLNGADILGMFSETYMPGVVGFFGAWLVVFMFGAIYSELMSASGSVQAIAHGLLRFLGKKRVILVMSAITAALIYGGVNAFVVIFILWPICVTFSKESDVPKRIWVPSIYVGMMSAFILPGSPAMSNIIAAQMLGTAPTAAPVLGIVGFAVSFVLGWLYLELLLIKYRMAGIGYEETERDRELLGGEDKECPGLFIAALPLIVLLVLFIGLSKGWFGVVLSSSNSIIVGMVTASFLCAILNLKRISNLKNTLINGSTKSINPVIAAAVISGFVSVVSATPAFAAFVGAIQNLPGHPYFQVFTAGNLITMVTGSATVAVQTTLNSFAETWTSMGMNPDVIERLLVICVGGMSLVPQSGGLYGVMDYTGTTHKESYLHILLSSGIVSLIAAIICILLAMIGIS